MVRKFIAFNKGPGNMEDSSSYVYRGWNVHFDPPPIPSRQFDWEATHPDYDGAEDANDNRIVWAGSRAGIQSEIDEWYADNEECPRSPAWRAGCCFAYIAAFILAMIAVAAIASAVTWVSYPAQYADNADSN